jgi:hypothetical protein
MLSGVTWARAGRPVRGFAPAALIGLGVGLRSELQRSIKKRDQTLKADAVQQLDNEKVHQRSPSLFFTNEHGENVS